MNFNTKLNLLLWKTAPDRADKGLAIAFGSALDRPVLARYGRGWYGV